MAKCRAKKIVIYSASAVVLLSGVSSYALKELDKINAREFADSVVVFQDRKIPIQEFYENLAYYNDKWIYQDQEKNKRYSVKDISDFNVVNKVRAKRWLEAKEKRHTKIDTVYYTKVETPEWIRKHSTQYVYQLGTQDSLANMPSLGFSGFEEMLIRQFEPRNCKRDMRIEIYNDKYNCTSDHEGQHFYNKCPGGSIYNSAAVGQIGQSHELTFVETCLDEISANIKQLLAQRQKYLDKGNDFTHITPRFGFYAEAIKEGKINPEQGQKNSEEEKKLIANGVFDSWMKEKYNLYKERNMFRTLHNYRTPQANYNAMQENLPRHHRVVKHMFYIDGIDFSPYIFAKEKEILGRITPEQKAIFAAEVAKKKANMTHLDKLEQIRLEQGQEAFDDKIQQNANLAKANRLVANIKEFFGFSR